MNNSSNVFIKISGFRPGKLVFFSQFLNVLFQDAKRRPPLWLQNVLKLDEDVSKKVADWADRLAPLHSLRVHYKALEVSTTTKMWIFHTIIETNLGKK